MAGENEIDDVEYLRGYAGFKAGGTARAIIERGAAASGDEAENKAMSAAIGFVDALLDQVRGIAREFDVSEETRG